MTIDEMITRIEEASRKELHPEYKQLIEWLTELKAFKGRYKIPHPECFSCRNRKVRIICCHCTRNDFAPSGGDNKQDYLNQEVDVSIFEKRKKA